MKIRRPIQCLLLTFHMVSAADNREENHMEMSKAMNYCVEYGLVLAKNPSLVRAVEKQNAQSLTMVEILKRDNNWKNSTSTADKALLAESITDNQLNKLFEEQLMRYRFYLSEILLTDQTGSLVATAPNSSDYWQGDELGWTRGYNNGQGGVYFSEPHINASTARYVTNVSLPVKDNHNKVIGVVILSINYDYVHRRLHPDDE